jgi:hypothetical protein
MEKMLYNTGLEEVLETNRKDWFVTQHGSSYLRLMIDSKKDNNNKKQYISPLSFKIQI